MTNGEGAQKLFVEIGKSFWKDRVVEKKTTIYEEKLVDSHV